jgi:pimeloyl-ACP methyl ester carboxylesterase
MSQSQSYDDRYFTSIDGQRLHYRDYRGPHEKPPILCLPGLTRNARDFEPIADRFAGDWRVIVCEFRGRGLSEFDPVPARYTPATYHADTLKLLDQLGIADAVFVGTSLGGLVTMVMAKNDPDRIAGALLNDIGPAIDPAGIRRIGSHVGKPVTFATFEAAVDAVAARNAAIYPDFGRADWERFTRRIMKPPAYTELDYDMRIADTFEQPAEAPAPEAWSYFDALAGRPVTILRGELSDLLSVATAAKMVAAIPDCELVTVQRVGHTPTFDEPESLAAVERLLERVEGA